MAANFSADEMAEIVPPVNVTRRGKQHGPAYISESDTEVLIQQDHLDKTADQNAREMLQSYK